MLLFLRSLSFFSTLLCLPSFSPPQLPRHQVSPPHRLRRVACARTPSPFFRLDRGPSAVRLSVVWSECSHTTRKNEGFIDFAEMGSQPASSSGSVRPERHPLPSESKPRLYPYPPLASPRHSPKPFPPDHSSLSPYNGNLGQGQRVAEPTPDSRRPCVPSLAISPLLSPRQSPSPDVRTSFPSPPPTFSPPSPSPRLPPAIVRSFHVLSLTNLPLGATMNVLASLFTDELQPTAMIVDSNDGKGLVAYDEFTRMVRALQRLTELNGLATEGQKVEVEILGRERAIVWREEHLMEAGQVLEA